MSENLNWFDKVKEVFDGFEPDAQPNWDLIEKRLDQWGNGQQVHDEIAKRARTAERFAIGATALAAGLALWISIPYVFDDEEVGSSVLVEDFDASSSDLANFAAENSMPNEENGQLERAGVLSRQVKMDPSLTSRGMMDRQDEFRSLNSARTSNHFVLNAPASEESKAPGSKLTSGPNQSSWKFGMEEGFMGDARGGSKVESFNKVNESSQSAFDPAKEEASRVLEGSNRSKWLPAASQSRNNQYDVSESYAAESADTKSTFEREFLAPGAVEVSFQEACAGTEIEFALDGVDFNGSVLWNFGDGSFSQESAPSHVYDDAGTYDITVSIRAHGDGTIRTRTVENMIVVRPKPEAKMRWEFEEAKPGLATVQLLDETQDASSSTWLISDEKLGKSNAQLVIPGEYSVHLIASNSFGCQDVSAERIQIGDRKDAIAPGMFSPNGDGRYDSFLPMIVAELDRSWKLIIHDEKGQLVYETRDAQKPWNGNLKNGQKASEGSRFVWMLYATSPAGHQVLYADELRIEG